MAANVGALKKRYQDLQQKGELHYRIYVKTGGIRVDLYTTDPLEQEAAD